METQSSKKILFNKSMLFSLKAELLRKQEEVLKKKHLPQHKVENFKPPSAKAEKTDKQPRKSFKESLETVDVEELQATRKSKLALEKKSKLYDHLSDSAGSSQLAGHFLVDFNAKKQQEQESAKVIVESKQQESSNELVELDENTCNDENDWVEFTDCLGRTRKCHKSDLEMFMMRDKALMRVMNDGQSSENSTTEPSEKPYLVQKTNDYLQTLRTKWEEKEKDLLGKDRDIHYQDLLFDEARIHGVGYYSFSTNENERRQEMEELMKRREETLKKQEEAEQMRKKRDELIAARVAAARARQRARAGLPPEPTPDKQQKDFSACLLEFLTQQRTEAEEKANEEENKLKEEKEKERQKLREAYVREWDLGKEGVEDKVKKFREMTQEEYVEQQRDKRINEFAPPTICENKANSVFDAKGRKVNEESSASVKTWADVLPRPKTPPPPFIGGINENEPTQETNSKKRKGLYFSSKETTTVHLKNFEAQRESVPIENEVSEDDSDNADSNKRKNESSSSDIAPPATYDYYGPVNKKRVSERPFKSDIREAYAQGSKYLKTLNSNREPNIPKQYNFMFD